MARIELRQVCKTLAEGRSGDKGVGLRDSAFGGFRGREKGFSIEGLDLEIPDGQVMAVLGPSGCGKSTLLRLIAGLLPADGGCILYDGKDMYEVPPSERKIGMVFQNYALYPNVDSRANVLSYFLFRRRTPELDREAQEKYRRTAELLGVELEKLMDRMPRSLSGGEQQRVAVARCITRDPRLFLLDEPFSNLDQKLRERYRSQLRVLLKEFSITTVYVTHDQVEALILADLIALMNEGRIEQVGSAKEIYEEPRSLFAADFINFEPETPSINLLDGGAVSSEFAGSTIGVRPEHIVLGEAPGRPSIEGRLVDVRSVPLRNISVLCVRAAGCEVYVRVQGEEGLRPGDSLRLSLARFHLFDKIGGLRIKSFA
jgi:ABC-type sugar transport system ATPase subunit